MRHLLYLGVLAFIVLGSVWLEAALGTGVLRRWRSLLLTALPVLLVFVVWDAYAIARQHWAFDPGSTTGVVLLLGIPLEEVLFFLVVPLASVLTWEAVHVVRGTDPLDGRPGHPPRPVGAVLRARWSARRGRAAR